MSRVDELTDRLLQGALVESEWAELEALVAADPAARAAHVALLELEGVLRGLRAEFDLVDATLAMVQEAQAEKTAQAVLSEIAKGPTPDWAMRPTLPRAGKSHRRLWVGAGGAAIAAAVALGLWLGGRPGPEPGAVPSGESLAALRPGMARLTSALGAVELLTPQGEVIPAAAGREVPPGHTLRTVGEDSLASVEMPDRTTVEIAPDSIVRFVVAATSTTKPRLFLAAGQLTAAVPDGVADRQLVVGTGVAEVFAHTGTFVVSSAGPDSTRVDIKKGNVDVVRMDTRTRVPVTAGAAIVQAGFERVLIEPTARVDRVPARALAFPNPREAIFSPDGSEVWVASPRQLTRWTRDGGTANVGFPPPKGMCNGPAVRFSRDGGTLVTSTFVGAPPHREEVVQLRAAPDGDARTELPLKLSETRFWTVAPKGAWLAVADVKPNQKRLRVFDGGSGVERFSREFDGVVGCLAASPSGELLAAVSIDPGRGGNKIALLDPRSGDRLANIPIQKKGCLALRFSLDGERLAVGFNGLVQVWDVRTRDLVKSITGFERVVTCLAFSPDGRKVAAGTQDGQVWVWSAATGKAIQLIDVGTRGVRCVGFSPDGRRLVVVANNAPVGLWNVREGAEEAGEVQ